MRPLRPSLARCGLLAALRRGPRRLRRQRRRRRRSVEFDADLPKPRDYPIHGIDVSKYQGDIDWNAVAGSGVKFAWIKATEGGDHVDERFQANWEAAKRPASPAAPIISSIGAARRSRR